MQWQHSLIQSRTCRGWEGWKGFKVANLAKRTRTSEVLIADVAKDTVSHDAALMSAEVGCWLGGSRTDRAKRSSTRHIAILATQDARIS